MTTKDSDTTTTETDDGPDLDRLNANLARIEELSQRLMSAMAQKSAPNPGLHGPGQDLYLKTAAAYMAEMVANPSKIFETQVNYWGKTLKHAIDAQQSLMQGRLQPPEDNGPTDRRFSGELWRTHPYFNYLKQQYLLNAQAISEAVSGLEGLDATEKHRVEYFTQQIVDMMSPANFLATNPEALARAVETEGESLVKGLENLVSDIEANDGEFLVTLADKEAFKVGENLAATPGKVVYRNRMMELIQYSPATEEVKEIPLVIFPPWINKFYILDLKPKNSLIKWIVDQGYTLFVVSWRDPDDSYADVGLEAYIEEGYLTAIDEVRAICGTKKVNAIGYCIAGTTLAMTLSLLEKRGGTNPVNSATFFTTLTDFEDQGEFTAFLTDDFVDAIEEEVKAKGILKSFIMSRTFSFLRANDLVYSPAIRSYMMGEKPPAFDLLYWNGDGTNLPGRMAVQYLRWLCQDNRFAKGGVGLMGETLKLSDVKVPVCSIACETDHIAAWKGCFRGFQQMGSRSKTFILSESGHIAGIVNPPSKMKYGHYMNGDLKGTPEEWQASAEFREGSWWSDWESWLSKRSGGKITPRRPGDSGHEILGDAPGTYVSRTSP